MFFYYFKYKYFCSIGKVSHFSPQFDKNALILKVNDLFRGEFFAV